VLEARGAYGRFPMVTAPVVQVQMAATLGGEHERVSTLGGSSASASAALAGSGTARSDRFCLP
jgi:hypothetical protein